MDYKILTGSALKLIAIVSMSIDHTAAYLTSCQDIFDMPVFTFHGNEVTWFFLMRCVGRLSFPLFAFLIVEGFIHTRNRRRYGWNLFICALISEIPWALLHNGFHILSHNVIFTLLWGYLGLCAIERWRNDRRRLGFLLVGMLGLAFIFRPDYNGSGFAFIVMLYTLRRHPALQTVLGCCMLNFKWIAGLAFIPINMYNGRRGFICGQVGKYLFYAFYPAHLFVFWMIS